MSNSDSIWRSSQEVGDCDDWGIVIWHGEAGRDNVVYRYGSPMPFVSFPSDRILLSGAIRQSLSSTLVDWVRVPKLCITDPEVNWRSWGEQLNERAAELTSTMDAEEPQDIVVPPFWSQRRPQVILDPDYWFVLPRVKLRWVPERSAIARPSDVAGFYEHPVLPLSTICVDGRVLEILLSAGNPEMIAAERLEVVEE